MLRTIYQVLSAIFVLLYMLIIPAFIMVTFGSENVKTVSELPAESAQTGNVLGIESRRMDFDITKPFQNIYSIGYTIVGLLFAFTILSILTYRLVK